ncbi:MAG: hypothetical protein IT305_01675 [Chloroflexi bacterium]|nr:hypothetical protein [Chloroflexota bacterium]
MSDAVWTDWDAPMDDLAERGWWYRTTTGAVLVGAGLVWTSAMLACCVAAPLSLALRGSTEPHVPERHALERPPAGQPLARRQPAARV